MSKKEFYPVPPSSEITPEPLYLSRRAFMKAAGLAGLGAALAACAPGPAAQTSPTSPAAALPPGPTPVIPTLSPGALKDELGDPANSFNDITNYNNFYEFSLDKEGVAPRVGKFITNPWQVEVSGLVNKPQTFTLEDLLKKFPQEERTYRLRCVEAWSMVIPWSGFPLASLLKAVEPTAGARYVSFTSALVPDQMPGTGEQSFFPWPYAEGLRLDEAMHNLTLLATGLYGKPLPAQDGAPIRLVVPWKYGFKSAKSLVKIELLADQPGTFWNMLGPDEYGFYANVNPNVNHPRWSQASERRIGELSRRPTLLFNGYAEEVGSLYTGLDLKANY